MSDLHVQSISNQDDVIPLWKTTAEQKRFSAWANGFGGDADRENKDQFSSLSGGEAIPVSPAAPQPDDVFDLAYRKGWEDGQAALTGNQSEDAQACASLAEAIGQLNDLYSADSFKFILSAIESLFRRCSEIAIPDPKLLESWSKQLAQLVDQEQKGATLMLHPDDIALIDPEVCKLPLCADDKMLRGNLKLSHNGGWVEKGSEVVLDELRTLIDEFSGGQTEARDA